MKLAISPGMLELPPGTDAHLTVTIVNDGSEPLAPTLTVTGLDPDLITLPDDLAVLAPNGVASAIVQVHIPDDSAPGDQRIGVSVSDQDGLQREAVVTSTLRVGPRPPMAVGVEPSSTSGRHSAEVLTTLQNHSGEPIALHLDAIAEGVDVRFAADDVVLQPGEDMELPTRIETLERSWFKEIRHGALIEVRGRGVPVSTAATFIQRPLIPPLLLKVLALVTVLAVWAAAVIVVNDRVFDDAVESKLLVASPELLDFLAAQAAAEAAGDADGALGVDGEGDGTGGPPVVIDGSVIGPTEPAGTEIVVEQVGFGDEGTTSGEGTTRLAAGTTIISPVGAVLDRIETSTDEQGAFRISSGLRQPAYYRVTALRPGFEVGSKLVATTEEEPEVTAEIELVPADGAMSGRVTTDGGAALGGADITVTDGQLIYSATSATEGATGTWSLSGLATPATYQVIVQRPGYATATLLVDLAGGEQLTGVDAELTGGLGTIRGRATSERQGVGGITVALEGEGLERATTTLTDGELAGGFDFPALPFGTYLLTFSGDGWLTQTTEVTVDRGDVEVLVSDLRRSTGTLSGIVEQEVVPGGSCLYPDPEIPAQRESVQLEPCGGVGVTVVGAEREWRTTSTTGDGTFQVSGLTDGEYLIRFERFGYTSQFFDVVVRAGDRLRVPSAATLSTTGPLDGIVAQAASFETADTHTPTTVQMRLTPPVDADSAVVQGVIRDSTDPATPFAPPAGTRITIDDQDIQTVAVADGTFRLEGVLAGAHTLRIVAPGFDVFTEVIQVPFGEVADVGVLAITPLGSLALRITGGQSSVVGGAEVFVAPDPVAYDGTQRTLPVQETSAGVTTCSRTFVLDGAETTLAGLCATTDAVGDVEFRRTFATGNYLFVTPVNTTDVAQTDAARRATTVPLDHAQLVRRVDIDSGQTVRLDPNLQRYPTISGAIRAPSTIDEGLDEIDITNADITFRRIDPQTGDPVALPAGAPTPRISASADAGTSLGRGRYRIDRIPADDTETQYSWQLIIETNVGIFERGPGQPEGFESIDGLEFNDSETINAILQPPPVEIRFDVTYLNANGSPVPVDDALVRLAGTSSFQQLETAPFFRPSSTVCPGPGCAVDGTFDFQTTLSPSVVADAAAQRITPGNVWLTFGADGLFTMPAFYRPGEVRLELIADGYEPILGPVDENDPGDPQASFELEPPTPDASGVVVDDFFPVSLVLDVLPRDITGTLQLTPSTAYPAYLDDPAFGNLTSNADLFADLDVRVYPTGDPAGATPLTLSTTGTFTTPDRLPGTYDLEVTGPGIEPLVTTFEVPPGGAPYVIDAADSTVTRRGVARLLVEELELAGDGVTETARDPLPGVEVVLERQEAGVWTAVGTPLTTCAAAGDTGGGPACAAGVVTFDDLPIFEGTQPYSYRFASTIADFIDRTGVGEEFTLDTTPYAELSVVQDRYGRISGTVEGQIGTRTPTVLPSVTVTLYDGTGAVVGAPVDTTDGTFAFGPDAALTEADGPYRITFAADGYFPEELAALSFALNTVVEPDVVLAARPVSLGGIVTSPDGRKMYRDQPPGDLLPSGLQVDVRITGNGVSLTAITDACADDPFDPFGPCELGPAGYLFPSFDAGTYTLEAEAVLGDGLDDFRVFQTTIDLLPDEDLRLPITLPFAVAPLSGTVTTRAFERTTDPQLTTTGLADVEVTATLDADAGVSFTTTTDASGAYAFDTISPGTYTATFVKDGYELATRSALPVVSPQDPFASPPTIADETLLPTPVEVEVTVTSAFDDAAIGGADIVATYEGPAAAPGPAGSPFTSTSAATTGVASFSLPPGNWSFAAVDTDVATFAPRPYVVAEIPVPGDGPITLPLATQDATTPVPLPLELEPYVGITGTVTVPTGIDPTDIALAVTGIDATGAETGPVDPDASFLGVNADGTWTVWLPDVPTDGTQAIRFRLTEFDDVLVPVPDDDDFDTAGDGRDAVIADAVVLQPTTRDVQVELTSVVGNSSLVGLQLTASASGQTAVPATVTQSGTDPARATFTGLKTGVTWQVSTTDAGALAIPHMDATGVDLVVGNEGGTQAPVGTLIAWEGDVSGTVSGRNFATATAAPLGGATVTVAQTIGGDPFSVVATSATSGTIGTWRVAVLAEGTGTAGVTRVGYSPASATAITWGNGNNSDIGTANRTLTALTRSVEIPVVSSAGVGTSVDGVSVTVTYDGTGGPTAPAAQDVTDGSVTVTLAPGTWLITTSDGPTLTEPHVNRSGVSLPVSVATADPPAAVIADDLVLQRYASVDGVVNGRAIAGETPALLDGVSIAASAGSGAVDVVDSPTGADGAYRVWLAAPATGTITFSKTGYDDAVVDIADLVADEGLAAGVDVTQDVQMTATPRNVTATLTTTAPGINDGTFFEGVTLTAVRRTTAATGAATVVSSNAGGTATAAFANLAPGTWDVTRGLAGTTLTPNYLVDFQVVVPVGTGTVTTSLDFKLVSGTVKGENYVGAPAAERVDLAGVTFSLRQRVAPEPALTVTSATNGTWSAGLPAGVATTVVVPVQTNYQGETETITAAGTLADILLTATPVPVTVTVDRPDTLDGDGATIPGGPVAGATVTATPVAPADPAVFDPAEVIGVTSDGTDGGTLGEVAIELPPGGDWTVVASATGEVSPASSAIVVGLGDGTTANSATPDTVALTLAPNSKLYGTVAEVRGNDRVAIPGVRIRAERPGDVFQTLSTEPDETGENYRLQARAGTWRISATRDGETTLVDDAFEIRQDGPGSARNVLDIVLPTQSIDLVGRVRDDAGGGVPGATVSATSAIGTISRTSDDNGDYTLEGLDNRQTWAVTFTPPAGYEGRAVTRFVSLSGELSADLSLDQTLPSGLGTLEVAITGGDAGLATEVTLTESGPFPTLAADGRRTRTVQLDGEGNAVLEFEELVPGDGRTLAQNRFGLEIRAPGIDPILRSGFDVAPGGTTSVTIDLGMARVTSREVELILQDADGPLLDADVRLIKDTVVLGPPTSPAESSTYTFQAVEAGTWQVVTVGFEDASIVVTEGDGVFTAALTLIAVPEPDEPEAQDLDGTITDETSTGSDDTTGDAPGTDDGLTTDPTEQPADPGTTPGTDPNGDTSGDPGTDPPGGTSGDPGTTDDPAPTEDPVPSDPTPGDAGTGESQEPAATTGADERTPAAGGDAATD